MILLAPYQVSVLDAECRFGEGHVTRNSRPDRDGQRFFRGAQLGLVEVWPGKNESEKET